MSSNSTVTTKLKNKDCVNKVKYGSPKLVEVLREKCRQRMQEKRGELFNRRRLISEFESTNMEDTLKEMVRQELRNLTMSDVFERIEERDNKPTVKLETDLLTERDEWILQDYENMLQNELEYWINWINYIDNEIKEVFCPICQKVILIEKNNCVFCTLCGLKLAECTVQKLGYLINKNVKTHADNCTKTPTFMVIPDNNRSNLSMICCDCSTLSLIC